jgi:hypothetical protein
VALEPSDPILESTSAVVFEVVHAIALRGRVPALATGSEGLLAAGLVRRVAGGFQLTQIGHSSHRALLERERATLDLSRLEMAYGPLPALARGLGRLRTRWQQRSSAVDRRRMIAELGELVDDTAPVLRRAAAVAPRFYGYSARLGAAVAHLRAGDQGYAFDSDVESVGAVWHELHEDFLQTLGRAHEIEDV